MLKRQNFNRMKKVEFTVISRCGGKEEKKRSHGTSMGFTLL